MRVNLDILPVAPAQRCIFALLIALVSIPLMGQETDFVIEGDTCISCHLEIEYFPDDFGSFDVHLKEDLSCAGCHGGDPTSDDEEISMSAASGFIGIPSPAEIPAMCGKCHSDLGFMQGFQPRIHTDQVEQYETSQHGIGLANGDENVAECADCHSSHAILPAQDPRSTVYFFNIPATCASCHDDSGMMADYSLSTNQHDEFAASIHGQALLEREDAGAPACNDCHGNHGATPPGVANLGQVCGTCHANNELYFDDSMMADPFSESGLHSCIECHGYHRVEQASDDMIGPGETSVCNVCHEEGEIAYDVSTEIHTNLRSYVAALDSARQQWTEVRRLGMDDVEIDYLLREANQSLIQARTTVHTFDPVEVESRTGEGMVAVQAALDASSHQITEHKTRRYGLGLSTLFITVLAIGLYLKIRDIEQKQS